MLTLGASSGGAALGRRSRRLQGSDLTLQHAEAVGMPQMLGGDRRTAAERDEPVPTPQTTLAVHEPLAWRQVRLETVSGLLVLDPPRVCEAARESTRSVGRFGQRASALGQGGAAVLVAAEIDPEAGGAFARASGERRLKFVPKRSGDRGLETVRDLQRRQDRRSLARIRRWCKQPAQSVGLGGEPSQLRIGLARQIERRLLSGESVCELDLGRFDNRATLL